MTSWITRLSPLGAGIEGLGSREARESAQPLEGYVQAGMAVGELCQCESRSGAHVVLHQVVPVLDVHAPPFDDQAGCLGGPAEGAGVDVGRLQAFAVEPLAASPRLGAAPCGQVELRRLALSLYQALGVRVGLSVTYYQQSHLSSPFLGAVVTIVPLSASRKEKKS